MNELHDDMRLSERGEARRRAMLGELAGEMERVRVGRVRRKRAVVGVCAVGVIAAGVWFGGRGHPAAVQPVEEIAGPVDELVVPELVDGIEIARVGGAPTLDVVRVRGGSGVERVDDSVLLAELRGMGQGVGMIRRDGAVYLTASVGRVPKAKVEDAVEPDA